MHIPTPGPEPIELDSDFWMSVCGQPDPSTRDKFLNLTIHEFSRLGPGRFSHAKIARRLGVTVAMVNHYFGSRNGLISEAAFTVYSNYVDAMAQAVASAPRDPVSRLRAWIETQITFAVSVTGWAVVLNYPSVALEDVVEFQFSFRKAMTAKFNVNICRLAQLILDVKSGTVTDGEICEDNLDMSRYMSDPRLVALGSSISMSTLGAAVWAAGSHAPSAESPEAKALGDYALTEHVNLLIKVVETFG